jgi:hypothetical protein
MIYVSNHKLKNIKKKYISQLHKNTIQINNQKEMNKINVLYGKRKINGNWNAAAV